MQAAKTLLTFEEYATLPDDGARTEFVDGEVIELGSATYEHNYLQNYITRKLQEFLEAQPLGYSASECEFTTTPGRTRRADVCFYVASRFRPEYVRRAIIPASPDLAVEVVSPNDTFTGIRDKIDEYLKAGVGTVWVIYPATRDAEKCEGSRRELSVATLTAGCLPGFELSVSKLFSSLRAPSLASDSPSA